LKTWQTIITAAAKDSRFEASGFDVPRNWISFQTKPILLWSIESHRGPGEGATVAVLMEYEADRWASCKSMTGPTRAKFLSKETQGALCTALMAVDEIDLTLPLVIAPGDSYLSNGIGVYVERFIDSGATAGTIVFESDDEIYSYVRVSDHGEIFEVTEKQPLSKWATSGVFLFRSGKDFLDAAEWVLKTNSNHKGQFFVSSALNYFLVQGDKVTSQELLPGDRYVRLSRPSEIIRELERIASF